VPNIGNREFPGDYVRIAARAALMSRASRNRDFLFRRDLSRLEARARDRLKLSMHCDARTRMASRDGCRYSSRLRAQIRNAIACARASCLTNWKADRDSRSERDRERGGALLLAKGAISTQRGGIPRKITSVLCNGALECARDSVNQKRGVGGRAKVSRREGNGTEKEPLN